MSARLPPKYDECTIEVWKARPNKRIRLKAGCVCEPTRVFRCRAIGAGAKYSCGRYCCACLGSSDDNRCGDCWKKYIQSKGLE